MEFTILIPAGKGCFHKSGSRCYFHEFVNDSSLLTAESFCNLFGEYLHEMKCDKCTSKQPVTINYAED